MSELSLKINKVAKLPTATKKLTRLLSDIKNIDEKNSLRLITKLKLRESKINALEMNLKRQIGELSKLLKELDKLKHED